MIGGREVGDGAQCRGMGGLREWEDLTPELSPLSPNMKVPSIFPSLLDNSLVLWDP